MSITGKLETETFGLEVFDLDAKEFPQPWTLTQWQELDYRHNRLFTLRSPEGELVSFTLFGLTEGDDTAHLYKIVTRQEARGTSATLDFFQAIIKKLSTEGFKSIYLEVEVNNKRAVRFYEKVGLKILRLNRRFYSNGEDALIMSMTLPVEGI